MGVSMKWFRFDPSESEAVQKRLFELGYKWVGGLRHILFIPYDLPAIHIDRKGLLGYANVEFFQKNSIYGAEISKAEALQLIPGESWSNGSHVIHADSFNPTTNVQPSSGHCSCTMTIDGIIHDSSCHLYKPIPSQPWGILREEPMTRADFNAKYRGRGE